MDDADLLHLVREGKKPGAYLTWMAWPYASNLPGLEAVPIYWDRAGSRPVGVAVARAGCLVRDVITPDDIAFFDDCVHNGQLRVRYEQTQDRTVAPVLADCAALSTAPLAEMIYEIIIGLLLGYPRCCVKNFAEVVYGGKPQHEFAEVAWLKNSLYSLCLECAREGRILYHSDWKLATKKTFVCEECQHCWDHPGRKCVYD